MQGTRRRGRACPVPFVSVILAAAVWLAAAGFGSEEEHETPPTRSVRDGVYTEAQAARGKTVYLEQCVECHKKDLRGDQQMTPSLVGIAFTFRWKDKKLYDYFVGMRNTMPQGAPGSLSEETYADLVAFLLSEMGYAAGKDELSTDPEVLSEIVIESSATM
ncbi:MAG: cytochrome c [Gammaproteobacteria bacterium]|nr:cytochrome c [Gammaproteobacteria bacterium]